MESFFAFVAVIVAFVSWATSLHLLNKIKKREKQYDADISQYNADISMLCRSIVQQENAINEGIKNLNIKIDEKRFELLKIVENQESKVKASFDKSAAHANSISKALDETSEKLRQEIKKVEGLLRELKDKSSSKSEEHERTLSELEKKIQRVISNYKELRWQIENITRIDEDSKKLNVDTDAFLQNNSIEEGAKKQYNITKEEKDFNNSSDNRDDKPQEAERNKSDKGYTEIENIGKELTPKIVGNADSLDEEQLKAFNCIDKTNGNYFITGKAGTGKSYLLRYFQSHTEKKILKVAPTGIAALNIGGTTIHSAFGFKNLNSQSVENLSESTLILSPNKELVLKNMDVLIIDEISMVRADIFDKIDKILRIVCRKHELPFGGKQVIVFGDLFQLPPIADRNEEKYLKDKYGGIFFFNSNSYKNSNFSFIELRINHRQIGDQKFFDILNKIREGTMTDSDIDLVNQRYVEDDESLRRVIRLYPKRDLAKRINEEALDKIWGSERVYNAKVKYSKNPDLVDSMENNFQISATLKLKIGAMVMMTRNDLERRWVNGTLGIIKKLEENSIFVQIDGYTYEVFKQDFEMNEAVYENRKITYNPIFIVEQFPVILAYAITIHKSQGNTYQQIACDPSDCFAPGQAYVALSRCVDLKGVHLLKKLSSDDVKVDSQVREFYLSKNK